MAQYYTKPQPVEAWRYEIDFDYKTIPDWIFNLIVNHRLGYPEALEVSTIGHGRTFQLYDGHDWVPVLPGEWVVRYDINTISVITNEVFKESFEKVKAFPDPIKPVN